ncbi:MAG TPA: HAD-IIB family hydrolase [Actinomycetales bacterium]|nr:HAD-IIB family hydrolase [Actinomycetales bacterium]
MRLVATDLDGTIVRADQTISARTVAAFEACAERGVGVVVVTGRPARWLSPVVEALGPHGHALCANGAVVYDLATRRVVDTQTIARADVRTVIDKTRTAIGDVDVAIETLAGFRREPGYVTRWDALSDQEVGTIDELLADDPGVLKVLVRQEGGSGDAMLRAARPVLAGLASPTHSNVNDCLLEISALGVSKAATLATLVASRGWTAADVVAFGDMPNDVEMLRWAGRGYAMAGGHPEALSAADDVAPPCEEDGVAQVVEALLRDRTAAGRSQCS